MNVKPFLLQKLNMILVLDTSYNLVLYTGSTKVCDHIKGAPNDASYLCDSYIVLPLFSWMGPLIYGRVVSFCAPPCAYGSQNFGFFQTEIMQFGPLVCIITMTPLAWVTV